MSISKRKIKKNAELYRLAAGIYDTMSHDGALNFYREDTADGAEYVAELANGEEIRGNFNFVEAIKEAGNFRACQRSERA